MNARSDTYLPDGTVVCPVCRWPSPDTEQVCRRCGWRLRGEIVIGSPGPDEPQELAARLAGACRDHDVRAAVRSLWSGGIHDADRLLWVTRLVRGGPPQAEILDRIISDIGSDERGAQGSFAGMGLALSRLVAEAVDALAIIEIGPEGLSAEVLMTDELRVPHRHAVPDMFTWPVVIPDLHADDDVRRFQLAGGVGEPHAVGKVAEGDSGNEPAHGVRAMIDGSVQAALSKLVKAAVTEAAAVSRLSGGRPRELRLDIILVRRTRGWAVLEAVATHARPALRPIADIFQGPSAGSLTMIAEQVASRAPLRFSYDLVLVAVDPQDGAIRIDACELFPAGARIRQHEIAETEVQLVAPPHAARHLLLPIVARRGEEPAKWPLIKSVAMSGTSHEPTTMTARLHAAGRLDVQTRPEPVVPVGQSPTWPELLRALPDNLPTSGAIDVAFLVELGGRPRQVADRVELVRGVVADLAAANAGPEVQVAVAGYRDHYSRHRAGAAEEADALVLFYGMRPIASAIKALGEPDPWQAVPRLHDLAAPIEDALHALAEDGRWRSGARHVLIIVGSRPPHPARMDADGRGPTPCPNPLDWQIELAGLREDHGVECVVVVEDSPRQSGYAKEAWDELGSHGQFGMASAVRQQLVDSVGLVPNASIRRLTLARNAASR